MPRDSFTSHRPIALENIRDVIYGDKPEEELTEHQKGKLTRMRAAYFAMLDAMSHYEISRLLQFNFGISTAQANRDMNDAETLFGSARRGNKDMKRHIAEQVALRTIKKAEAAGDIKLTVAALKAYIDATGIGQEDPEIPDFEKLQTHLIAMVAPPDVKESIDAILQKGIVNLNQAPPLIIQAEDIEHEEVDE